MRKTTLILSIFSASVLYSQETDSIHGEDHIHLQEVSITEKLPITVEKLSKSFLQKNNLGQDIPTLLNSATSVSTTSDAGTGIGYSSIRIRGLNEQSVNVTLNGISLNDGESQGVFWVNMPDMVSSSSSMLIQRGVGTSSNGMASFGASINIDSEDPSSIPFAEVNVSIGSFNTQKYTIQAGTGKILNNKLRIDGRFSKINSDGYIYRSWSDLLSYNISALYELSTKTKFRFQNMFGREQTYQAWNGIDEETLKRDRRYNSAGEITNESHEVIGFYNNHTDNYTQNHYYLSWLQNYGNNWRSNLTIHYRNGKGYYESYKNDKNLNNYKLAYLSSERKNLVDRQYLDNDFYGFNLDIENNKLNNFKVFFGLSGNEYDGDHYGKVLWIKDVDWSNTDFKYFNNNAVKKQLAAYAKVLYSIGRLELFGDLQYRYVSYQGSYLKDGENNKVSFKPFSDQFNFVNPKTGINYRIDENNVFYASYGISQREPLRVDYTGTPNDNEKPKAEFLQDYEIGYKMYGRFSMSVNLYYMDYRNQLVPTGELNDVGAAIRKNSVVSYRRGIELDASYSIIPKHLSVFGNLTLSQNRNENYTEKVADSGGNYYVKDYGRTKIALSPDIISSFGLEFHPIKNLLMNLTNKYIGEQYLSNIEPEDGKLSSFLVSNILIRYTPSWLNLKKIEFSLLVNNIFDVKYSSNGYYYGGSYYFPQAGINILGGMSVRL